MSRTIRIAPSLLSADFSRLRDDIAMCEAGGADWIHVDVMDGHFVPNLTFGAKVIETVRGLTDLPLDVHMMVEHPGQFFEDFAKVDLVLIMSVDPGYGGQAFIPTSIEKIRQMRALLDNAGSAATLEVDGGINRETIARCAAAGADAFVAGHAIFSAADPCAEIGELRRRTMIAV
jgi:ribulose-phosphate 3-epimerase